MDYTKNLKVKELLRYHLRQESLKGIPNKMELVEAVTDFFKKIPRGSCAEGREVGYIL